MFIDPFEPGPNIPFWKTEYWQGDDHIPYQFTSHSETMAEHLEKWKSARPANTLVKCTGMVFTRAGHLVWPTDR
jgi:hypothetical protein